MPNSLKYKKDRKIIRHIVLPSMATEEDIENIIKNQDYLLTEIGYVK